MSTLKMKNFDGDPVYLAGGGAGTELNPFIPLNDSRIQDQTTPRVALYIAQHLDIGLTFRSPVAENDEAIEVTTSGSVPVAGHFLCVKEGDFFSQIEILTVTPVAGNDYDLTVAIPMDHEYTTGANVCLQNVNMAVDGSSTPVEFHLSPAGLTAGTEWDINRMIVTMIQDAAGDEARFGGFEDGLTTGVYHRVEDGTNFNIFNARINGDFADQGYDIAFPERSGKDGLFGTRARITFNGRDKSGVVYRLAGDTGDKWLACVRDDLREVTTGISRYRTMLQGQVVQP